MKPYKSIFTENKRSLREGFLLKPFTKEDWYAFDAKRPASGQEPMIGMVDIYIDSNDTRSITALRNIAADNRLGQESDTFVVTEDGDLFIEGCYLIVDANGVDIIAMSDVDNTITFDIRLRVPFEKAVNLVTSKFYKSMYLSDLRKMGFNIEF